MRGTPLPPSTPIAVTAPPHPICTIPQPLPTGSQGQGQRLEYKVKGQGQGQRSRSETKFNFPNSSFFGG